MLPDVDAALTGETLQHNEIFAVCEEVPCADGRIYLRLADGRGWAFDDSALLPEDPSVVRGDWMHENLDSTGIPEFPANTQWEPMEEPEPTRTAEEVTAYQEAEEAVTQWRSETTSLLERAQALCREADTFVQTRGLLDDDNEEPLFDQSEVLSEEDTGVASEEEEPSPEFEGPDIL